MLVVHKFGSGRSLDLNSELDCENFIHKFMQTGFQRPAPRQDKKQNNTIFFYPGTKFPDSRTSFEYLFHHEEKLSAEQDCETLINMHFDTSVFNRFKQHYDVFVVYRVPINLKLGPTERFQFIEDGTQDLNYHEIQNFYRTWPYKNNIASYIAAIKNKTLQKSLPIQAWELTLDYRNPTLLRPFCFVLSDPDNNLRYIPCFDSITRDEKKFHLLAVIQDKIDELEKQKQALHMTNDADTSRQKSLKRQSTKNAYVVDI